MLRLIPTYRRECRAICARLRSIFTKIFIKIYYFQVHLIVFHLLKSPHLDCIPTLLPNKLYLDLNYPFKEFQPCVFRLKFNGDIHIEDYITFQLIVFS